MHALSSRLSSPFGTALQVFCLLSRGEIFVVFSPRKFSASSNMSKAANDALGSCLPMSFQSGKEKSYFFFLSWVLVFPLWSNLFFWVGYLFFFYL